MKFEDIMNKFKSFVDNKYVTTYIYLFLILYASLAAPKLPHVFTKLFDYSIFRMLVIFGIGYLSSKDATAALLATIGIAITMYTLNLHKTNEALKSISENVNEEIENFIEHFKPVESPLYEVNYENFEPNSDENKYKSATYPEDFIEHFEQKLDQPQSPVMFEGFERY